MNANGELVVLRFTYGKNHKTGESQFQVYLGDREQGTLYIVDRMSTIKPEIDQSDLEQKRTPWYICEERSVISRVGDKCIVTVIIHGVVDVGTNGYFNLARRANGAQWQCNRNIVTFGGDEIDVFLVVDRDCKKPEHPSNWVFELKKPITCGPNFIVMAVNLVEEILTERCQRRREGQKGHHSSRAA